MKSHLFALCTSYFEHNCIFLAGSNAHLSYMSMYVYVCLEGRGGVVGVTPSICSGATPVIPGGTCGYALGSVFLLILFKNLFHPYDHVNAIKYRTNYCGASMYNDDTRILDLFLLALRDGIFFLQYL